MPGKTGPVIVGAVALEVVPDTTNFLKTLAKDIGPDVDKAAGDIGDRLAKPLRKKTGAAAKEGLGDAAGDAAEAGSRAASAFAGAFARKAVGLNKVIEDALPDFKPVVAPDIKRKGLVTFQREVDTIKAKLRALTSPEFTPKLNAPEFLGELGALKSALASVLKRTPDLEIRGNTKQAMGEIDRYIEGVQKANVATGSFARSIDAVLGKVLKGMSDTVVDVPINVMVDGKPGIDEAAEAFHRLREDLNEFRGLRIGIDISDDDAERKMREFQERALAISEMPTITTRLGVELADANKDFAAWVSELDDYHNRDVVAEVDADIKPAERSLGTLQAEIKSMADKIVKDNLDLKLKVDPTPAERSILELVAMAERISVMIGLGVADKEAIAELLVFNGLVDHVTRTRKVEFETDAGGTRRLNETAKLVGTVVDGVEAAGKAASQAGGFFANMVESMSKMGPAALVANISVVGFFIILIPLILLASAAIVGLIGLLGVAAAIIGGLALGLGVLVFAFRDIITAIGEKEQAAKQAAANAAQDAATELSNYLAIAAANRAIATAVRTLARARVSAVTSVAQANRTLAGAQRNLVIANQKEADTRRKLGLAHKAGRTELALLTAEIRANRIEQQAAIVSITQAREAYNRILADPTASESAIEAAQSEYNMKELALKKLKADQLKDKNDELKDLKANHEAVLDAQDAVATAKENAAKAATDAANSISDAERGLTDARTARAATLAQQQAAAIATAAQRAAQTETYDNLDPAAKAFVDFYETTLKPMIHDLMGAAQKAILPGVTAFFKALSKPETMVALTTAITQIGIAFGDLLTKVGDWLASKDGQDFIKWLGDAGADGIKLFADLLKTMGPLVPPLTKAFSDFMKKMTPEIVESMSVAVERLVKWLESPEFTHFVDQMVKNGPDLIQTFLDLTIAVTDLLTLFSATRTLFILDVLLIAFHEFFKSLTDLGHAIRDGRKAWVDYWSDVRDSVSDGVDAMGQAWSRLREIMSVPINAAINLINSGIIGPINAVVHWVGGKGIDPIKALDSGPSAISGGTLVGGRAPIFKAHGGVLPGYAPGQDIIPVWASPGEGWLVPQAARQIGAGTIDDWNARARRGQPIQRFATGGTVDKPTTEATKATGFMGTLLNPIGDGLTGQLGAFADRFGDSGLVDTLTSIPVKMFEAITAFFLSTANVLATVGSTLADAGSSVLKYLGLDQDTGDAKADQSATGIMATPQGAAHYAKNQLPKFHWDAGQMDSLAALWNGESGWRWNAKNPLSGAYGIPQALPGTKMGSAGSDWAINAFHQVDWGLGYIRDRYKDPAGALAFWQAQNPHWYDQGGYLPTGITLVNNSTGGPERILNDAQWDAMSADRGGGMDINVRVHDGAVTGLVSTEVDRQFGSLADAHIYGGA